MNLETGSCRTSFPTSGWWAAVVVLTLILPQFSWLIARLVGMLPFGNVVNLGFETAVSHAFFGASTGLAMVSCPVVFAFVFLHSGSRWKRLGAAAGFLILHCIVSASVLFMLDPRWSTIAMYSDVELQRFVATLLVSPSLSVLSIVPAAVAQFFFGWKIQRQGNSTAPVRIGLMTLFEWVLISAVLFTVLRAVSDDRFRISLVAFVYELVLLALPATGLGLVTIVLFRRLLSDPPESQRTRAVLHIVSILGLVYVTAVAALQYQDERLGVSVNAQYAVEPLTFCIIGTFHIAAIVVCFRKLGYRLTMN